MLAIPSVSQHRATRLAAFGLFGWISLAVLMATASPAFALAQEPAAEQPNFFVQVLQNLFDSRGLMKTLGQPEFTIAAFIALNVIVFVETGLLIGFCLPGDSLLVTAGLVASNPLCGWNLPLLLATLCLAAICGDSIGYAIGFKTGPRIFCRQESFFFHKGHLLKAQEFYEKYGGKTIILARFVPVVRTFAPVVAGVGQMDYRRFLFYNVFGGIGWVCSMVFTGYFLPALLNPALRPFLGEGFAVEDHVEKVVIVVVLISVSPGLPSLVAWMKNKMAGKKEVASAPSAEDQTANEQAVKIAG
jgi:membrane-associated protein